MDAIKQWLNGSGDYLTGVDLFLKHSTDKQLRQVFLEGCSPYKQTRLRTELMKLLNTRVQHQVVEIKAKQTVVQIMTTAPKRWGPVEQMDAVVKSLYLQWKPLFAQRNSLQNRLHDVAKLGLTDKAAKQEAGSMAHMILDLDDQLDDIYQKRDQYRATGALPATAKPVDDLVVDPKKLPTALANAKRYVREYKTQLKADPKNEKAAQQLTKWEQRVQHYENILNG